MALTNQAGTYIGLVALIAALAVAGINAHEKVVTDDLAVKQHLTGVHLTAKKLNLQFIGEPDVYEFQAYSGKGMYSKSRSWTVVSTPDWTLVNRWAFGGKCMELFNQIGEFNKFAFLGTEEVLMLAKTHQTKFIGVWAYTPTFTQEPAAMASCAQQGLAYDKTRGMLTAQGKPIALLADPYLRKDTPN